MVDFTKRRGATKSPKPTNPIQIYEGLDRASDKGPLRPAQERVLVSWHQDYAEKQDTIIKLHTGQGKTLVGLLILQAKLNAGLGPALYLCPNKQLVQQTAIQARQFGIKCVSSEGDLPTEFIDGTAIYIASVQKLFNGLTKFKLGPRSEKVGAIALDDSHACLEAIRSCFTMKISNDKVAYQALLKLFEGGLKEQGKGTYEDIKRGRANAFLPIPYWEWEDNINEVTSILSKNSEDGQIRFQWSLLKDALADCLCFFAGDRMEIAPYNPQLAKFRSFTNADHRIFMSATMNDDSFFIKTLGVSSEAVENPILDPVEAWSGERMILIPSLFSEDLDTGKIVQKMAVPNKGRKYGNAAITPSFKTSSRWSGPGANVADGSNIYSLIEDLKAGEYENTAVFVNRYDGIDLPDGTCRVLTLDGMPFSNELSDQHAENCRDNSDIIQSKIAQKIEQGLGRHIRGEKDYGVAILIGNDLVRFVRSTKTRQYFSPQTRAQVEIGLAVSQWAKEDIDDGKAPETALDELVSQCVDRDDGWKQHYIDSMNDADMAETRPAILEAFVMEKEAEKKFYSNDVSGAVAFIQNFLDTKSLSDSEMGWYLQEMARYEYRRSKTRSNELQQAAHTKNSYLLKPREGMKISKITDGADQRIDRILKWMNSFATYDDLRLSLAEWATSLNIGINADRFEKALDNFGKAIGFVTQRPDKEWREGPDHLWLLRNGEYFLVEAKSEVSQSSIPKADVGQLDTSVAWFKSNYPGAKSHNRMAVGTPWVDPSTPFNNEVELIDENRLSRFRTNVLSFFREFEGKDRKDISAASIEKALRENKLDVDSIIKNYSISPKTGAPRVGKK